MNNSPASRGSDARAGAIDAPAARSWLICCGVAFGSVAVALALRWSFQDLVRERMPFTLFGAAIALSAWIGRWRAGTLAAVLSAVVIKTWLIEPIGLLNWTPGSRLATIGYLGTGAIIIAAIEAAHVANDRLRSQLREGRQAAEELRQRAEETQALLQTLPIGVLFAHDPACQRITANAAGYQLLHARAGSNLSKTAADDDRPTHFRLTRDGQEIPPEQLPIQRAARGEHVRDEEIDHIFADGATVQTVVSAAPLFDAAGKPRGAIATIQDMTERKRAEQALRTRGEQFETLVNRAPQGVYLVDADFRIAHVNPVARLAFGDIPGGLAGRDFGEISHLLWDANYADELVRIFRRTLETGACHIAPEQAEYRVDHRTIGYYEWRVDRIPLPDGRYGLVCYFRDISAQVEARKQIEESRDALRKSEARLHGIITSAMDAMITVDARHRIVMFNPAAEAMFGWSAAEMEGREVDDLVPERLRASHGTFVDAFGRTGVSNRRMGALGAISGLRKDGGEFPIEASISQIDISGEKLFTVILRDISERVRAESALREAKDQAEAANRAKDNFLAALSHELRNPLTPVLMAAADLAESPDLSADAREQLEMIRRNVQLESRLIDDLLDLTRIVRGRFDFQTAVVDVHHLLRQTEPIIRPDLVGRRLDLEFRLEAVRHLAVADEARLQQVFWNLLKNAIKFTPDGGKITVVTAEQPPDGLCVQIIDTGRGIPPEALDGIFRPFDQGDLSGRHSFGGLGLGLAICRAIVDRLGGKISASSAGLGRGATFSLELALASPAPAQEPMPADGASDAGRYRVLVVDDHSSTRDTVARLLRKHGHEIHVAGSVVEALQIAARHACDLLVTDLGLPDGSGFELMDEIKRRHGWPGIALSGYGTIEDQQRAAAAGFSACLVKPVDLARLRRTISDVMQGHTPAFGAPSPGGATGQKTSTREKPSLLES